MTAERALPYYDAEILPRLLKGENVLVAAHGKSHSSLSHWSSGLVRPFRLVLMCHDPLLLGNSLRAIIMQIEQISEANIVALELATGVPMIYTLDAQGHFVSKEILERMPAHP